MSIQYAGGTNINATFTGNIKTDIQSNVATQLLAAGWSQATGPSGGGAQTVTISIASPGVVTLTAHGLLANDRVVFATTGALPTGFTAGTSYFVKTVVDANNFTLSTTSGGTVINTSGSQSGTQTICGTVRMKSASTPWSVALRINMQDCGLGSLVFSLENSTGTLAGGSGSTNGAYLLPATSRVFRVVANKYQAFIFVAATSPAKGFVAFGTPYLATFLQGVLTECGWLQGNTESEASTTVRQSLRTSPSTTTNNTNNANQQGITNGNLFEFANAQFQSQGMGLVTSSSLQHALGTGQTGIHWHDGSAVMIEPLITWPTTSGALESLIRGQIWDAVLIQNTFAGDTTTTFDSHNWINLTDNDTAFNMALFVVTP